MLYELIIVDVTLGTISIRLSTFIFHILSVFVLCLLNHLIIVFDVVAATIMERRTIPSCSFFSRYIVLCDIYYCIITPTTP